MVRQKGISRLVITVIPAESTHAEAIAVLAQEMDSFYGETRLDSLTVRVHQIREALFGTPPVTAHVILAWDTDRPVGFASYSFLWPAVGLTRSLYLKELYVSEAVRRIGVGRLLMQSVCQIAVKHGCSRVEWTTDRDTAGARAFYASLGLSVKESKLFYRLEGEHLGKFGSSL
ncbi:MAG TPA: GNAT family N-acetyltransferase [Micromonosporaceae bacterium]